MGDSAVHTVDFHFDPMCPFAYHTSVWLREVREVLGFAVRWRFFSLEEINRAEGKKHPWQRPWSYGWSLMRIGALLRRTDNALVDDWYAKIGHTLHVAGGKPHDPEVARALLAELGHDPALLEVAIEDESTHQDVHADHQRVIDAGGFGVPTLFLRGTDSGSAQCLFGPVLIDPPTGQRAVELWRVVTGMSQFPNVFELQRPKSAVDQAAIETALRPYLAGRDWHSVNRGQIVEFQHTS
ncbi:2-hydroxychromene-2-carboxylate isomerase [Tamaricihabitans halophyticus]|uniref:2-hydroxychromene-2-carboxylate isomerase n=1 Tax=Tamaricihabitans halophyticus TaxID=1262583 RepID=A0A4R2QI49_9PSEU|nr:hypothetical protein [Tamaricihabitans halophyticus]TCP48449.1 2-hydroxychromene-2-carboxylate isomerase [Tamaricihabitans halophyticus]